MQEGRKNDRKDDKTRWELMPLDCLEDIARVYTEGAKKYGDNTWQNLDNGYERYKGALLRHLYASESKEFDEETKVRHEAAMCYGLENMEEKINKILENQQIMITLLIQILKDVNRSQFLENYVANKLANFTDNI